MSVADIPPRLSVIVIAYDMPDQLANTLFSLSAEYQRGVDQASYEVVVVENCSEQCLSQDIVESLPENFRYFLRDESSHTPVPALNFAFKQCRGKYIGVLVDGARLLTPGILALALDAMRRSDKVLVATPGYHLGETEQHVPYLDGDRVAYEQDLLQKIDWKEHGYRLFQHGVVCGANPKGYLQPLLESNCMFASKAMFEAIGYADSRFQLPGGGSINLHMFRALGLQPDVHYTILPGEGTFHQFHGGITTSDYPEREPDIAEHLVQLQGIWQGTFKALSRKPELFGDVRSEAKPMQEFSETMAVRRENRLKAGNKALWEDDEAIKEGRQFIPEPFNSH